MTDKLYYIKLAHRLNHEHHDRLMKVKAHFRGNMNSMSLVSLAKETPELGFSGIRTEKTALSKLGELERRGVRLSGRITPEKELQAWIICKALNSGGRLPFGQDLLFITSELALYEDGKKWVNDLLALDKDGGLVVIELKTSRDKTRLEAQVAGFIGIIQGNKPFFQELVKLKTGREWNGSISGMVIWNAGKVKARKIKAGIREFWYLDAPRSSDRVIQNCDDDLITFEEMF